MSYYESAEDTKITKQRAMKELDAHGVPTEEKQAFFAELGRHSHYEAQAVLQWLGY